MGGDEEFYSILHEQMGYSAWSWDYELARNLVMPQFPQGGRILDIGAGTGLFLDRLGPLWEKHAVEGSEKTREILRQREISVHASLSEARSAFAEKFDLITIFQVLEHLSDFRTTLCLSRELLKPNGQLMITVPDGDAMLRQERLTGCPDMPPNHINKWTPNSLELALNQSGLKILGNPIPELPAWKNVAKHLHLKVSAESANPHSLAAQIYRIKYNGLRKPMIAAVGCLALLKLANHWTELRSGGAFAVIATK